MLPEFDHEAEVRACGCFFVGMMGRAQSVPSMPATATPAATGAAIAPPVVASAVDGTAGVPAVLSSTATLVLVPTLVQSSAGELVHTLEASNFRVTDNGVAQQVALERMERQPIAMVVLMQTGASAPRQFGNYSKLAPMLEAMVGSSAYRVALVTFDSRPEEIWAFPPRVDGLKDAFANPQAGDKGAAVLDAVSLGLTCWRSNRRPLDAFCCC